MEDLRLLIFERYLNAFNKLLCTSVVYRHFVCPNCIYWNEILISSRLTALLSADWIHLSKVFIARRKIMNSRRNWQIPFNLCRICIKFDFRVIPNYIRNWSSDHIIWNAQIVPTPRLVKRRNTGIYKVNAPRETRGEKNCWIAIAPWQIRINGVLMFTQSNSELHDFLVTESRDPPNHSKCLESYIARQRKNGMNEADAWRETRVPTTMAGTRNTRMYIVHAARFTLPPSSAWLFQAQAVQECAHVQLRTSVDKNTRRYNVTLGTRATIVISLGLYSTLHSWKESKHRNREKNEGKKGDMARKRQSTTKYR